MAGRTSFASALLTGCCTWMISRAVLPAQRAAVSGGQRAAVRARPAPALRSRSVRPAAWAPRASGPALRRPLRAQPEGAEGPESAPPADEAPPVEAAAAPEAPPPTPAPAARAKDAEDEMDVSDVEWTSDADWAASEGYSRDGMDVAASDEGLRTHAGHLQYRWAKFVQRRRELEKYEGGLEEFSMGYRKYGFNREGNATVYREWAPAAAAASLIGDFNGWNPGSHVMERDQFGTWTVRVPDKEDGSPGIAHGSRVKIQLQRGDGWRVDRIPAWIKYATVEAGRLGALYDGVYWDPPAPYEWRHEAPPRPRAPRIYEAHVGMSAAEPACSTYRAFADDVLPRVAAGGYNTVQLMAVQEHAYYASFGYHVTNFFGVSSRSGNPDDLKYLVDTAHGLGLRVLLDIVHSHASSNADDGLNGFDFGQESSGSYFHSGARGYHTQWDSRCFRYDNWEVQRFLLSNVRYWMTEYKFDGFRFDGVTSMLYTHHGINRSFSGNYSEYFGTETDVDAVVYLMLANDLAHRVNPEATVLAEDVSGMPTLCRPVTEGGIGFDGRLAMAVPDHWIKLLKEKPDEAWNMHELVCTLCNRRYSERSIAYAESHDQALVGDKTIAFWLMDRAMYDGMSTTQPASPVVARGVALHKVIRGITAALGGEGYLNFMGNEFGHPEWIDFPRAGNGWSYQHCRRQWQLADADHLRYGQLGAFDRALMELEQKHGWLSHAHQMVSVANDYDKTIVAERGDLLWVFNFHTHATYSDYAVPAPAPGVWRCVLDSDAPEFGGNASAGAAECVATAGGPDSWVGPYKQEPRAATLKVRSVSRSVQAYLKVGDAPAAPAPPPAAAAAAADPAPAEAAAPAPADAPADAPEPVAAEAPPAAE